MAFTANPELDRENEAENTRGVEEGSEWKSAGKGSPRAHLRH